MMVHIVKQIFKREIYIPLLHLATLEVSSLANLEASFKLDFTALYNRLCETVDIL